jgi:hypothetical protein
VRLSLVHTGNRAVADWDEYLAAHPEPKRPKRSVGATGERVEGGRPAAVAKAGRTRKAREVLGAMRGAGGEGEAESLRQDSEREEGGLG